jgi:FAD/FMN-containing dehydrogenase
MGADNIIEAVIVTPTGDVLKVNACQNEDLFWAIRGGGGGTFGIIISITVKAYKMPSTLLMGINVSPRNYTTTKEWYSLVAQMHSEFSRLQTAGIHGYYTLSSSPISFSVALMQYNGGNKSSDTLLMPMQEILRAANTTVSSQFTAQWTPSWYDLVKNIPLYGSTGAAHSTRASRFIPRRAMKDTQLLARTLESIMAPDSLSGVCITLLWILRKSRVT